MASTLLYPLPLYFQVIKMHAEPGLHEVTIEERRRPLPPVPSPAMAAGSRIGLPTRESTPPVIITVEVTPDQFQSLAIGEDFDLTPSMTKLQGVAFDVPAQQARR